MAEKTISEQVEAAEKKARYKAALMSGLKYTGTAVFQTSVTLGAAAMMGYVTGKVIVAGMKKNEQEANQALPEAREALNQASQAINKARTETARM